MLIFKWLIQTAPSRANEKKKMGQLLVVRVTCKSGDKQLEVHRKTDGLGFMANVRDNLQPQIHDMCPRNLAPGGMVGRFSKGKISLIKYMLSP